jgi:undecaprenyl-diphosphatase
MCLWLGYCTVGAWLLQQGRTMLSFLERLDHQLFFALNNGLSSPLLDYLLGWVSLLGHAAPLALAAGAGLWWYDRQVFRQHYAWLVLAVLVGGMLAQGVKYGFGRPRPLAEFATLLQAGEVHISVVGQHLRRRSFPSGHTQAAAAVFVYLTCLYPRCWYMWVTGIFLVGLSRIYVGVHFPADVFAGALLGGLIAWGTWRVQHLRANAYGSEPPPPHRRKGAAAPRHS